MRSNHIWCVHIKHWLYKILISAHLYIPFITVSFIFHLTKLFALIYSAIVFLFFTVIDCKNTLCHIRCKESPFRSVSPSGLRFSIAVTNWLSNVTHDPNHFSQICFYCRWQRCCQLVYIFLAPEYSQNFNRLRFVTSSGYHRGKLHCFLHWKKWLEFSFYF